MTEPVYATPAAFKQALEQRLRTASSLERVDLARRRQLLVFDRFLARVFSQLGERVCLKGGLVLELRLARARTTKDVDLRCIGEPERIVEELRAAGQLNLGDFMAFELAPACTASGHSQRRHEVRWAPTLSGVSASWKAIWTTFWRRRRFR